MSMMEDDVLRFLALQRPQEAPQGPSVLDAIAEQETRGQPNAHKARNARTGAYGTYQIMPSNWGPWSKEAFGEEVPKTAENQRAVAAFKLQQYEEQFGPEGAAVAWYAGPTKAKRWLENPNDPWFDMPHGDGSEPSVRQYVQGVMGRMPQQATEADILAFLQAQRGEQAAPVDSVPQPAPPVGSVPQPAPPAEPQPPSTALSPREQGRQVAEEAPPLAQKVGSFVYGANEMLFNIGTPFAAVGEMIESRLDSDPESFSYGEARDYIRGKSEGFRSAAPKSSFAGHAAGLVGSFGLLKGAGAALESAGAVGRGVKSVFTLEKSRTARNIAKLSATGAAAAGVNAGLGEGLDEVPGAVATGGVTGALMLPAGLAARGGFRQLAGNRQWAENLARTAGVSEATRRKLGIDPDGPAIRTVAKRLKESPEAVAEWFNRFKQSFGRTPALAELLDPRTAEEIAMIAHRPFGGAKAVNIFKTAEEAAASRRPGEVSAAIRGGGPTTSVEAVEQALPPLQSKAAASVRPARATETAARTGLAPIADEAAEVAGQRAARTPAAIEGLRDVRMDAVIKRIGGDQVPVTDAMHEVISHPDVQQVLPGALRRRLNNLLEAGEETGAVNIPVRIWDAIRQELGKRAGPGAGLEYTRLRNKVTDYVGDFVPEYGEALRTYARRSNIAEGARLGSKVLSTNTNEFVALIETAGGGTAEIARNPQTRAEIQAGARGGARSNIVNSLKGGVERAQKFMERLSKDPGLRSNVRAALSPDEARKLEDLAMEYGHQLRFAEGVAAGTTLATKGTAESLAQALRSDIGGVGSGVRQTLAGALEGGSESAGRLMQRLSRDANYRQRVTQVLSGPERRSLGELAESYGHQLDIVEGAKVGAKVGVPSSTEAFQDAVAGAYKTPGGAQAVQASARGTLASAAGESPKAAGRVARALDENPGLQQRLQAALGGTEAAKIQEAGASASRAEWSLSLLTPAASEAAMKSAAQARNIQTIIGAGVIGLTGRASAAMRASVFQQVANMLTMSPGTVRKTAEMLVDPARADKAIKKLIDSGATSEQVWQIYQKAALAAGIKVGGS